MKYAIFPGDSRIFSVTLAASPEDKELRAVLRPEAFRAATESLPATSAWVDPAVSEPITKVYGYADLYNRRRFFVKDDKPLALGIFPIGDALVHQNPLSGRGCTLGWVAAWNLAEAWSEHAEDPNAFALALDAAIVRDVITYVLGAWRRARRRSSVKAAATYETLTMEKWIRAVTRSMFATA